MPKKTKKPAPKLSLVAPAALESMRRMRIGVLSVLLEPGQPYSAVVNVHVDDRFRLYFACHRQTRKFKALLKQPKVAFNMGFQEEMVNNFQIIGKAAVIKGATNWQELFEALELEKPKDQLLTGLGEMTAHYPFRLMQTNDTAVVMIEPSWIRWFRHTPDAKAPQHVLVLGKE
jgi:hypothetical protein